MNNELAATAIISTTQTPERPIPAGSLRLEHLSRAEPERRERRRAIDVTSERWKERRRRNKGGLQAFSPRISKYRPVFCKDFKRKLWRFCGISRGYMGPNREKHFFQIFSRRSPPFRRISDFVTPSFVDSRHTGTRALSRSPASFAWSKASAFTAAVDPDRKNFFKEHHSTKLRFSGRQIDTGSVSV